MKFNKSILMISSFVILTIATTPSFAADSTEVNEVDVNYKAPSFAERSAEAEKSKSSVAPEDSSCSVARTNGSVSGYDEYVKQGFYTVEKRDSNGNIVSYENGYGLHVKCVGRERNNDPD